MTLRRILGGVCFVLAAAACFPPTEGDKAALEELEAKFGDRFAFGIVDGLYLRARQRTEETPSAALVDSIYNAFWTTPSGRRDAGAVYLNLYDEKNQFRYQVSWNRRTGELSTSRAEYY